MNLIALILTTETIIILTATEIAIITWGAPHLLTRDTLNQFFQPIRKAKAPKK